MKAKLLIVQSFYLLVCQLVNLHIHPQNAEFIKYYIVPKLVFSPSILDSDSIDTLLGPQHRLLLTLTQNTVSMTGTACKQSTSKCLTLSSSDVIVVDWQVGGRVQCASESYKRIWTDIAGSCHKYSAPIKATETPKESKSDPSRGSVTLLLSLRC